jgi:hypothetical protein
MRPFVLGVVLMLLQGCVLYQRRPYAEPAGQAPAQPVRRILSQDEAVDVGFRLCRDRGLRVERVEHARLDPQGRWHVSLAGYGDRGQMILDGRDGKLLKGRFHREDSEPPGAGQPTPAPPPARDPSQDDLE